MQKAICCLRFAPRCNLLFAFCTLMQLALCILHLSAICFLHLALKYNLLFAFPFHFHTCHHVPVPL